MSDPYAHHPELRGKITNPQKSFFRDFNIQAIFEQNPEMTAARDWVFSDAVREANRQACLAAHRGRDLWVFGYGSLMWDPALVFAEVRRATVVGHARRFILLDNKGGRGTPEAPGLMAALDQGDICEGLAFRITAEAVEVETEILWRREMVGPGYISDFVDARIAGEAVKVLTFLADHEADEICSDLARADQVRMIAQGAGILGTARDYLENVVKQFEILGIEDEHCSALLAEVEAFSGQQGTA